MSKIFRPILPVLTAFVLILHLFNNSNAQDLEVNIKFDAAKPEIVSIEGKRKAVTKPTSRNLSFLTSIAGQEISGERISNLKLFDSKGAVVPYKRFMPGEYVAAADFVGWNYQVDITPPKDQKLMAHVSWMTKSTGILMLNDLLPQFARNENIISANIGFDISFRDPGFSLWPIYTAVKKTGENTFITPKIDKATFYIGSWDGMAPLDPLFRKTPVSMYFLDVFQFDHNDALNMAVEIYQDCQTYLGNALQPVTIGLVRFSDKATLDTWDAETRGRNITILTSDTSFKSQALQQLHEQLRHEIFHLWIPNGVNLSGNYDWFYEGFALYQSLKTGVALNRLRFDDYLDTLSRAYDVDKRLAQKLSLIDISKNRWAGDNNTRVYARGMLVAFLCDLALLEKSKGKRSVADILRKLYETHRPPAAETDGNAVVLSLLRSYPELTPLIDRNITGLESIEWNDLIKGAGLEAESADQTTKLKVTAKPSGRQKDLLDKLGYNNWRKLTSK